MSERQTPITPEAMTAQLWSGDHKDIAQELLGREVIIAANGTRIRIDSAKPWSKDENSKKASYRRMSEMEPGTVYLPDGPYKNTRLALIVAKDGQDSGACVQISKGAIFNRKKGIFETQSQTRIADAFTGENTATTGRIVFKNSSDTLFYVKDENPFDAEAKPVVESPIDPGDEFDQSFQTLLDSQK